MKEQQEKSESAQPSKSPKELPWPGQFKMVHKSDLMVDHTYQRDENGDLIAKIRDGFDPQLFGALIVAHRLHDPHHYMIIDGQQRYTAVKDKESITLLPCMAFETDSVKSEAAHFVGLNTVRKSVKAEDKFKARVAAQDPVAVEISEFLSSKGCSVNPNAFTRNNVRCITTLESAWKKSPELVREMWPIFVAMHAQSEDQIGADTIRWVMTLRQHKKSGKMVWKEDMAQYLKNKGANAIRQKIEGYFSLGKNAGKSVSDALLEGYRTWKKETKQAES